MKFHIILSFISSIILYNLTHDLIFTFMTSIFICGMPLLLELFFRVLYHNTIEKNPYYQLLIFKEKMNRNESNNSTN